MSGALNLKDETARLIQSLSVVVETTRDGHFLAVTHPQSIDQVAETLKVCRKHGVSVQPVSTGRNWGYSAGASTAPRQVLMRLERMRNITAFDETIGVVTIDPGVTQGQLATFLKARGDRFYADMTAAGPDTSILGNLCDRGFGNSPLGNRAASVLGFDVMLADGRIIATDGNAFFPSSAATTGALPPGPNLTQLFIQSNFGIVLRARIQLNCRGSYERIFGFEASSPEALPELVERIGKLKQQGVIPGCIHIANDVRILSNVMRRTRRRTEDLRALTEEEREDLGQEHRAAAWTGFTLLSGPRALVRGQLVVAKCELKAQARVRVLSPRFIAWCARRMSGWIARLPGGTALARKIRRGSILFEMLRGEPSNEILYNTAWRLVDAPVTAPTVQDLDAGKAGIHWYAPSLPLRADRVKALIDFATPILRKHGFDVLLMFTCISDRMGCGVFNILYDPRFPSEVAAARACLTELVDEGMKHDFVPYRLNAELWPWLNRVHPSMPEFAAIKTALDPDDLIAPGRYGVSGKPRP